MDERRPGWRAPEIIIFLVISSFLFGGIFSVDFLGPRTSGEKNCKKFREEIEWAEQKLLYEEHRHSKGLQDLVESGRLPKLRRCPGGGIYAWISYPKEHPQYRTKIVCSLHTTAGPEAEILAEGETLVKLQSVPHRP